MDPVSIAPVAAAPASRTFGLGEVLGASLALFGRELPRIAAFALLLESPVLLVLAAIGPELEGAAPDPRRRIVDLVSNVLFVFTTAGVTHLALEALAGRRARLRDVLGAAILKGRKVFVAGFLSSAAWALGLLLLVIPGLVLAAGYFVAVPAAVAEDRTTGSGALARSWELSRGRRVLMLGVFLLSILGIFGGLFLLATIVYALEAAETPSLVLVSALQTVLVTFLPVSATVAYHRLRREKEGEDPAELGAVFE